MYEPDLDMRKKMVTIDGHRQRCFDQKQWNHANDPVEVQVRSCPVIQDLARGGLSEEYMYHLAMLIRAHGKDEKNELVAELHHV